jgi:hypothetical protein
MKDLVVGLVVWATVVAALLIIAPKSHTTIPSPSISQQQRRPTAGDLLRIRDQQTVDSMILTNKKDAR